MQRHGSWFHRLDMKSLGDSSLAHSSMQGTHQLIAQLLPRRHLLAVNLHIIHLQLQKYR